MKITNIKKGEILEQKFKFDISEKKRDNRKGELLHWMELMEIESVCDVGSHRLISLYSKLVSTCKPSHN